MKVIYLLSFLVSSADVRAWSVEAPAASTPPTAKSTTSATELFPDTAVAKGKGFEIKRSQLDDAVTSIKATA